MLKLHYYSDICHQEIGSDPWINAVRKYAQVSVTAEQEKRLIKKTYVVVRVTVGPCRDGHLYTCYTRIRTVNSVIPPFFSYSGSGLPCNVGQVKKEPS